MSEILQDLNNQQRTAVEKTEGPILIIAGPGSGKTRCLTHKVAYLIEQEKALPSEILAVTFTNKAANEMKERVRKLIKQHNKNVSWIGTFHATCARILRIEGPKIGIPKNYVIYDTYDSEKVIKEVIQELKLSPKEFQPGTVLSKISSAKNELVTAAQYKNYAYGYFQEQIAKIYPKYQKVLGKNKALDFGDLILKTVQLLNTCPEILEKWQGKFKYFLVDEYQDTNQAQYTFIHSLAKGNNNLCVVGDVSQAIYGWRGANFKNILNFEKDWPNATIFHLEKNYRSTQKIIEAAKKVIEHNKTHININLQTENEQGQDLFVYQAWDEKDEARYVARKIEKMPTRYQCAVLFRTNAQSRAFEEAFIRRGLPYRLFGGTKFYERREIKDILSYLRLVENPQDTLSLKRIINVPPRRVGEKTQEELARKGWKIKDADKHFEFSLQELIQNKDRLEPQQIINIILGKTKYLDWIRDRGDENEGRVENVKELRAVASEFNSLKKFLENVSLVENDQTPNGLNLSQPSNTAGNYPITILMTLHSAKGLEFPVVFITGLEEGLLPHSRSLLDLHQLEEERRLFYVGMTRAKRELHLTYAKRRLYFGGERSGSISRFLLEIPENLKNEL
ncbi:MAG: UvrD-helicase domain-containing protein [Patescibacteria group bacterium]|nr:UvrD-helicase domain-containing protein [Patescibacteria group bacterium]